MTAGAERKPTGQLPKKVKAPLLHLVEKPPKNYLLQPSPITDKGEIARILGGAVTAIKENYHRQYGVFSKDKLDGLFQTLQREAITEIFQDLQMLPANLTKDQQKDLAKYYEQAEKTQKELVGDADRLDELMDKYEDTGPIRAVMMLGKTGVTKPEQTAPILRTVLVLLDEQLPPEQN